MIYLLAIALVELVGSRTKHFDLLPKDLLIQLNAISENWPKDPRFWPQSPEQLSHRLARIAPALRAVEVGVEKLPRTNAGSPWKVGRIDAQGKFSFVKAPDSVPKAA